MKAQIVRSSLHQGGAEWLAERLAQQRDVFEEDLFLKILGARGNEDALAAEDRRDQIGERLASPRTRFGEQRTPTFDDVSARGGHGALTRALLVAVNSACQRTVVREDDGGRGSQLRTYCS